MTDTRALIFSAGSRIGALPIGYVEEVMRPLPVERLASEQSLADGVALIRGAAVPVLNVEVLFGEAAKSKINRFITVRVGDRWVALAVSAVLGVRDMQEIDAGAVPPLLQDVAAGAVETVGRLDEQLLTVLQTSRLVPDELWAELDARGAHS